MAWLALIDRIKRQRGLCSPHVRELLDLHVWRLVRGSRC